MPKKISKHRKSSRRKRNGFGKRVKNSKMLSRYVGNIRNGSPFFDSTTGG